MEVSTLRLFHEIWQRTAGEKLPMDTTFLCDANVMAAMFSKMVNNTP
jgi:hypothetical protein